MQTSYSPAHWVEDGTEERQRALLDGKSDPALVRQLFPLRARLLATDASYGFPIGHVFEYARTKHKLSLYPIEVCAVFETGRRNPAFLHGVCHHYNSEEAELLPPLAEGSKR